MRNKLSAGFGLLIIREYTVVYMTHLSLESTGASLFVCIVYNMHTCLYYGKLLIMYWQIACSQTYIYLPYSYQTSLGNEVNCTFSGTVVFMAVPLFEETGFFSFSLPNSVNMAFYFPWLLQIYPFVLAGGKRFCLMYKCIVWKKYEHK